MQRRWPAAALCSADSVSVSANISAALEEEFLRNQSLPYSPSAISASAPWFGCVEARCGSLLRCAHGPSLLVAGAWPLQALTCGALQLAAGLPDSLLSGSRVGRKSACMVCLGLLLLVPGSYPAAAEPCLSLNAERAMAAASLMSWPTWTSPTPRARSRTLRGARGLEPACWPPGLAWPYLKVGAMWPGLRTSGRSCFWQKSFRRELACRLKSSMFGPCRLVFSSWAVLGLTALVVWLAYNSFPDYTELESFEATVSKLGSACCCARNLQATAGENRWAGGRPRRGGWRRAAGAP